MSKFYRNRSIIMIASLAVIIIVIIAATSVDREQVSGAEDIVGILFKPATNLFTVVVNFVRNAVSDIAEIGSLRDANELLNQQVITLKAQVRELEMLRQENERLREMLAFKDTQPDYELIGCSIIGKDPSNVFSIFLVDKGSRDGIAKNMPVVTNKGLVGQVLEVGSNWAKVLPLSDPRSSVSVIVNRTRDPGILEGRLENSFGGHTSPEAAIVEGDELVTSGMGGIYPKGLYVGRITGIYYDETQLLKMIDVEPVVDFGKLEEVFVLKFVRNLSDEGEVVN
jgi:rod shape-determining protein MreC